MPKQPPNTLPKGFLRLFRSSVKIALALVVVVISLFLGMQKFIPLLGLTKFSDFFKEYQTWFGSVLAYVAVMIVGQPIIKIAKDVQEVKEDLEEQAMEAQKEQLNQLALSFQNGIGVTFKPEDGILTAFKAGIMVEMGVNGDIAYYPSATAKIGRYYVLNLDENTPPHKLKMLDDVSQDEIDTVKAVYKDGTTRESNTIIDFEKASAFGKTTIVLHASR
ncbi:MAG: hypothetical protein QM537_03625 [Candidatus Symbiobacter sp.]|nr:hypothetical protein [Candidatus Symbiobacter sp.]